MATILEAGIVSTFGAINKTIGTIATGWGEIFALVPGMGTVGESLKGVGKYLSESADESIKFAKSLKDEAGKQLDEATKAANQAQDGFKGLAEATGDTTEKLDKIWKVSETVKETLTGVKSASSEAAQAQSDLANTTSQLAQSSSNATQSTEAHTTAIYKTVDAHGRVTYSTEKMAGSTEVAIQKTSGLISTLDGVKDKETKVTADTTQAEQKIDEVKKPTSSTHAVAPQTNEVDEKVEKLKETTDSKHAILPDDYDVKNTIAEIQKPTSSTHTIYTQTVQQNANGGQIQYFATGGQPKFIRREGGLGGYGGGDTVPAMLEAGEWIIKKESVNKYGNGFMAQLNEGKLDIPRFSTGGRVDRLKDDQEYYKAQLKDLEAEMKAATASVNLGALSWSFYNPFAAKQKKDSYQEKQRKAKEIQKNLEFLESEIEWAQESDKLDAEREKKQKAINDENKRIADEQRRRDEQVYKQKEETLKLKGDDAGLENLRYEREKQELAGNEPALQQAAINNQLALAKIEEEKQKKDAKEKADADKKAADEAKKITDEEEKARKKAEDDARKLAEQQAKDADRLKIEGFKLTGDDVGLENFNYEKEKQSLAD